MRLDWLEEQEAESRRSPDGGVCGGNDVGGVDDWGGAEGNESPLGEGVCEGEHEGVYEGVPLQQQCLCVRVGVQSMTERGGVAPGLFLDSLRVVR